MKAIGLCVLWCAVAGVSAFAAESISITATPRYPWNGKVDLKFTIDGTSGTKYDTSFTAKDVAGGTNLTMKTLYKSNGIAANVAKEQLLPGTYNWVWDATADLGEGTVLEKVVVEGKVAAPNIYMVVNLKTGAKTYLSAVPDGGWTDDHRKTLMVFRRVNKGTNSAGGSMSKDMWVGIFEVTRGQHTILTGNAANYEYGTNSKHFTREDTCPTCIEAMDWAGGYTTTTATTKEDGSKNSGVSTMYPKAFTKFASISGLSGVRLPSWPEWQYAARAGTTTYYGNGTSTEAGLKLMACYNASATVKVGSYQPNGWGLYDMHGNADELLSLAKSGYAASAGGDCCSSAAKCKSSSFLYWGFHSVGVVGFRIFIEIK